MWMKSTGVAVYKSQCSLSKMILSMRRISAVEKLHPLCITRSLMEPITCVKRHKTKKGINIVLNRLCCRSQSLLTSSSSLILAARTREVNAMHRRYFGWAWKTPRDSGPGSLSTWRADALRLNGPETPSPCSRAFYLDGGQQAVEDADSQRRGVWTEPAEPAHLPEPKDHFSVLRWRDVCALRRRWLPVRTTACLEPTRASTCIPEWLTWMEPFLKTGAFQRRSSLLRAASSRTTSRRLSTAPGCFMVSREQARLDPGHKHLTEARGWDSDNKGYV